MIESPRRPRSPWQRFYSRVHRWRREWWATRAARLPRPVISVGNLHWGGTGKTPLTLALAKHLRDAGKRVAVLSRGYKRHSRGIQLVSDGTGQGGDRGRGQGRLQRPEPDPSFYGDEPVLIAREAPGVAVVVGEKRDEAGLRALESLDPPPDLFLLDDGFSHLRLARDLELLVFPVEDPFAGGRLLPSGRLREPLDASRRAHAVLLTGDPARGDVTPEAARRLAEALHPFGFRGLGFAAPARSGPPRTLDGRPLTCEARVLLVSAIARPERFHDAAIRASQEVGFTIAAELRLADHDPYAEATLDRLRAELDRREATVVLTTSKDLVKLEGRLDRPLAELPLVCEPEPELFLWLGPWLDLWEAHPPGAGP